MAEQIDLDLTGILNREPAFGLGTPEARAGMANLVRCRISLEDHLNFNLIKSAVQGFIQMEISDNLGVPLRVLEKLNTSDIPALYRGINKCKGLDMRTGEIPFGELIPYLVGLGYQTSERNCAANAFLTMINLAEPVGFRKHPNGLPRIQERMAARDEQTQHQFLRAYHTPRLRDADLRLNDRVYQRFHRVNGEPIDSNEARDFYVALFVEILAKKQTHSSQQRTDMRSWVVPSATREDVVYFVQEIPRYGIENGALACKGINYTCSCPHGWRRMHGGLNGHAPQYCHHILDTIRKEEHPMDFHGQGRLI